MIASKNKNYIKLVNSVFKEFQKYKLSIDERQEIFLDALWHSLKHWISDKSLFTTYLRNTAWYKTKTYIKNNRIKKYDKTNVDFSNIISEVYIGDDFDAIVSSLHDIYKIPLTQKFVYNMSLKEIAEANGYKKSLASKLIKKGLEKIKKSV